MPGFYTGDSTLTPHRQSKSHTGLTATRMKTKELAQDVQDAVEEDFTLHYRVTDTDQFLKKLLPVEQATLDAVLLYMKNDEKLYDATTQRWTGFPDPTHQESGATTKEKKKLKEKSLYSPFCATAEAIRKFLEKNRTASQMGDTKWVDYHANSPKTEDRQSAQLRPDALFALRVIAEQAALKECQEVEQEVGGEEEQVEGKREAAEEGNGKGEEGPKEGNKVEGDKEKGKGKAKHLLIWWLQIIAAVEMKPKDSKNWDDVVKQLFGYLRRILREQLDRRFVFGLTLGPDTMTIWMHDRSGVIGTKTAINIHKEPLKFIQVIAAFSLLTPDKLGFDPTIEMLVSHNQVVPSYQPNEAFIKAYETARHNRRWVIRMNDGTKYKTVDTVSSVRAGFMRGRGSIVWVVVPFNKAKEESKFYVLKQSWCPRDVDRESNLCDGSSCEDVGRIELCEEVLICGLTDTTDTLIRQSLDDSMGHGLGKRPREEMAESREPGIHVTCTDIGDIKEVIARQTGSPSPRVRTRVILSTYGWVIKYFSTRKELLVVLRDAIRGHKYLYESGVLHRDISPGNILIKWQPGSQAAQSRTSGCLIDLDHAKKGKLAPAKVNTSIDDTVICRVQDVFHAMTGIAVEKEVARLSLEFFPMVENNVLSTVTYISAALAHASNFRPLSGKPCTPQHLGWHSVKKPYSFEFRSDERRGGSRTGTPPYTSGEIVSTEWYFRGHHGHNDDVFHDAIHDLESFFWVLIHICITRQGPGGVRREELEQKNELNEAYNGLRRVIYHLFDSEMATMAANKARLFTHSLELEPYILDNFHPYFQPLKEVVKKWFHLLILAHKFHAYEYHNIHDMVLEILDCALKSAPPEDISAEATLKVLDERKTNIEKLLDGNPFGKVQQSPPHTSPTSRGQGSRGVYHSLPSSPSPAPKRGKH